MSDITRPRLGAFLLLPLCYQLALAAFDGVRHAYPTLFPWGVWVIVYGYVSVRPLPTGMCMSGVAIPVSRLLPICYQCLFESSDVCRKITSPILVGWGDLLEPTTGLEPATC